MRPIWIGPDCLKESKILTKMGRKCEANKRNGLCSISYNCPSLYMHMRCDYVLIQNFQHLLKTR